MEKQTSLTNDDFLFPPHDAEKRVPRDTNEPVVLIHVTSHLAFLSDTTD